MCALLSFRHRTVNDPLNQQTLLSYDAAGRLIQVQEGTTRLQYDYDQADRLMREVQDTPSGFNSGAKGVSFELFCDVLGK